MIRNFLLTIFIFTAAFSHSQTVNIYVTPAGSASGNGASIATPVSLAQARVVAKANPNNPCVIWLTDGIYSSRIVLDATDSRTASAPVTYKAYNPEKAVFQVINTLDRNLFQAIPDSIKTRVVDTAAKQKVMQLNLTPLNLQNMNVWPDMFEAGTIKWPMFFKDSVALPIAQYPNDTAVMTMDSVLYNGYNNSVPGGTFKFKDARTNKWLKAVQDAGLWMKGNWRVPWQITYIRTAFIDTLRDTIQQAKGPNNGIGDKYTRPYGNRKEPYVAINLLEEIDKEGEWAINFKTKMLYMWPPATGQINYGSDFTIAAITLTNVSYTNFENIAIRSGTGGGVSLTGCNYVRVSGMDIAYCYGDAIIVNGGFNCTINSNDLHELGQGGVIVNPLSAAQFYIDENNLTSNNHRVVNNHIYNFAQQVPIYSAAVNLTSVIGTYVANNKIHGTPHVGILYNGNNNVIDYNEFYDIIKVYNDMGAIYSNGYSGTTYKSFGNKFHYNYIHDSPQSKGSMFDNTKGGDSSCYNIDANNYFATQNSNGYYNIYTNSIAVSANPAAEAVLATFADTSAAYKPFMDSLNAIWNRSPAFQAAYPQLIDLLGSPVNRAYTSRMWPRNTCNVYISNAKVFNGINDASLFNADGTTNSTYAQTSTPWTTYKFVFANNTKMSGVLVNKISPFLIDSLKATRAFAKTCNTDWHINRIGLYADSFRTNIASSDVISGIAPTVIASAGSNNNFVAPTNITLSVKAKNPNIANCVSQVKFFDNNIEIPGLTINVQSSNFDSITYTAQWPGATAGNHSITAKIYDAPNWVYTSNTVNFTVSAALPVNLLSFKGTAKNCNALLEWTTAGEINMNRYEVEQSNGNNGFSTIATLAAGCPTGNTNCNYSAMVSQPRNAVYRLKMIDNNQHFTYSPTINLQAACLTENSMRLFPNPAAKGKTTLSFYNTGAAQNGTINISDIDGRIIQSQTVLLNKGENNIFISTANLQRGVYQVQLISKTNFYSKSVKLIAGY